jgi:hypothetical protein
VVAAVIGDEPELLEPNVPVDTRKRPREHSIFPMTVKFADTTSFFNVKHKVNDIIHCIIVFYKLIIFCIFFLTG